VASRSWSIHRRDGPEGALDARRAVALLAPATFFQGYDDLVLGFALPLIAASFHLSDARAGVAVSLVFLGSFATLILLPFADRVGRRPVLTLTIVGYTAATFATAFSRGLADLVVCQFVARVFLGTEYALATIVLVELLPRARRGRSLGLVASMAALGQAAAGAGFLTVLALGVSWRWLYLVGIAPLVLVAWARRALPESAAWEARRSAARTRPDGRLGWIRIEGLRPRWLVGSVVLTFVFSMFPTAVTTFASLLVLTDWHWSLHSLRPWYFLVWAAGLSGFFVAGRLLDTWGRRPATTLFFAGSFAAGLAAFTATTSAGRVFGLGLVIFFLTGATPCAAIYGTEPFPPEARGRIGAAIRAAAIGGAAAAPAIAGLLSGPLGGLGHALAAVGASYLVGATIALTVLPETRDLTWAASTGPAPPGA